MFRNLLRTGVFGASLIAASQAASNENVMVVFDGSNSMWGQIDGTAKIEIARDVMENLLGDWVESRQVGLMAYGHRRRGDCGDIEILVAPGAQSRQAILDQIGGITPTGKTPLTDAVEQAAKDLSYTDRPATVVLISDGVESCQRDPCALAAELEKSGVAFTAHVVGFGLTGNDDESSLSCIAENTGGQYISASNATELGAALSTVSTAVATAEPEPELPQVIVDAPATAVGGSDVLVRWSQIVNPSDDITIVPVGTEEGKMGPSFRVNALQEKAMTVPGEEGSYEIRYTGTPDSPTLGMAAIEITKPSVTLTAPAQVETGAEFDVSWAPGINAKDYITIVPAGADAGSIENHARVRDKSAATLRAPADAGLYEVRYVLSVNRATVASSTIEVTPPSIALTAPDTALTGSDVPVAWSRTVDGRDYVTIVPVGAKEGSSDNFVQVRDDKDGIVRAPANPGMYEVRYILREGKKTLTRRTIEITDPVVTVSGPESVVTGSVFDISWTGTVHPQDHVAIVPAGSKEGEYGNYLQVRDKQSGTLRAQADPGLYELRYILREGKRTLVSVAIEVTDPEVTVSSPDAVLAGSLFDVSWTGAVSEQDYVNIVPAGTDEGVFGNYLQVRKAVEGELRAPAETGLYELRYVLREGNKTLATKMVEVTAPEVTVSSPDAVLAGSLFDVSWTGAVSEQDYVNIVPAGTDEGVFGNYLQVRKAVEGELRAPAETGLYELRYVLREGNKTLATKMVEVTAPEVTVSAPQSVIAGSVFEVSWTGTVSAQDYINIVPVGTPEGKFGNYIQVREADTGNLQAQAQTGIYEVRYILREGNKTLATQMVEITEPQVTVSAPPEVRVGDQLTMSWTGTVNPNDYIALVPAGSPENTYGKYGAVRDKSEHRVKVPDETGLYEVRYILREGPRVLASQMVEVLPKDAALDTGASIDAPDAAPAGSTITVGWQSDSDAADQRITLARADQAIFTWITALKITGTPPMELTLPDAPGIYELRILDVSNQAVLSRKAITVE